MEMLKLLFLSAGSIYLLNIQTRQILRSRATNVVQWSLSKKNLPLVSLLSTKWLTSLVLTYASTKMKRTLSETLISLKASSLSICTRIQQLKVFITTLKALCPFPYKKKSRNKESIKIFLLSPLRKKARISSFRSEHSKKLRLSINS